MALHFSKEEFSNRKTKVLKLMKEQNLDALLMFRQESMYWLTGYDTFGYVFFQTLVLDKSGNLLTQISVKDVKKLINNGTITGGMIPKVKTCVEAVKSGVKASVILDGRLPHSILLEMFTEHGVGTLISS